MVWRVFVPVLFVGALLNGQGASEDPYSRMLESQRQVRAYLERAARALTDRSIEEVSARESWEKVREQRRTEMRDMLGLLPWPRRSPLNLRITGTLDKGSYTVENIAFESMPKLYVTGNLYVPKQRSGRLPAIVYVCGHAMAPQGNKTQYQRHGITFAKNGYVAFILDSIQIAETFALHHGVSGQDMNDWYSRGYTPAGVEVWNAMRAIDYLQSRPEVDGERIGMTGRSGGAAMSWFTAAVDDRVKVVAPVMGISTYAANVVDDTQKRHCDCMFAINTHRHDMLHQGALIAPRPLLMAHGSKDLLFPVPGYEEFERVVSDLYNSYGVPDSFTNVVVDTDHKDSDFLREQAIRWFDKHLLKVGERPLDMDYSNAPPEELAVFKGVPPSDAVNLRVHETFTTRPPSARFTSLEAWQARRLELLATLRQLLPTEPDADIAVRTEVRKPGQAKGRLPGVLYVASDGEDLPGIFLRLGGVQRHNAAVQMIVWPRGVGEVPWPETFHRSVLRNAMHIGETVDSMRVRDVVAGYRKLRELPEVDPARIMIAGKGISGTLGLYAAILDPSVHQVMLIDPPSTHAEGPIFLNIMRHTDLPEAAALLAPRRLNFYARMPAAFDYTRHVYALHDKADHVFVAMNLEFVAAGRYDHNLGSGW